jgi:hypothetical protein
MNYSNGDRDLPDFEAILAKVTVGEEEQPKPPPQGTYRCRIDKYETGRSDKKQTPYIRFMLMPLEADIDVDEKELEEAGGLDGHKTIRATYWLTPDAIWRLSNFLTHCGCKVGVPALEVLDDVINREVMAKIRHVPSPTDGRLWPEVVETWSTDLLAGRRRRTG